jgi:serine phosphatase RsbU (regulator of sigma subunit)/anti-sigma regulatory factor (Ser/Thr protein kinase)
MVEHTVSSRPAALRLILACDLGAVRRVAQAVRDFLALYGCDENELNACDLALVEACNNAVKYAPAAARNKPIIVEVICEEAAIEMRVRDNTEGFKWPAQAQLPDAESESGRGIFLMQSLMNEAKYYRADGENLLVLRKERSSLHQPADERDRVIAAMVEELSSCYESLSAIFRYSAAQTNIRDLKQFAQSLLADLMNITGADWFCLRLSSHDETRLFPFATSDSSLDLTPLPLNQSTGAITSVELESVASRREVWFDSRRPLSPEDPLGAAKPGSHGLVHPIFTNEDFIGTLTVGKTPAALAERRVHSESVFTAGQANVVGTFADFLAVQVTNARFHEEQVASRLVAHELDIANNIQQSLLPKHLAALPGFQLAAFCRSAHQVGGDFYDVLRINEQEQLLVIADVMGKGVPAAMFAAILRTMLRASPELAHQPAALLTRVNRLLFEELSGVDMFITAQLAYLNAGARRLVTASAGHCPLLLSTVGGEQVKEYSPEGMPLGILHDTPFAEETIELPPNSRLLLYTDGLPEALNSAGERFGQDRLVNWFQNAVRAGHSAEQLNRGLTDVLAQFQANMLLNDDQTYLIMAG